MVWFVDVESARLSGQHFVQIKPQCLVLLGCLATCSKKNRMAREGHMLQPRAAVTASAVAFPVCFSSVEGFQLSKLLAHPEKQMNHIT